MSVANYTADDGLTVRQRALNALKAKIAAMTDGGAAVWQNVWFGDLDDIPNSALLPAAGIWFGDELKIESIGGCDKFQLPVFISFRWNAQEGLDEHLVYQYYLGLLQKTVMADIYLGGLATDINEEGNSPAIIGINDVYPGGMLHVMIMYRTRVHNPYKLLSE